MGGRVPDHTAAGTVRTSILLAYGADGMGPTQEMAWPTALSDHGVDCELVLYEHEGHLLTTPENTADLLRRAVTWFTGHGR